MDKACSKYSGCLYYSTNALARIMTKIADDIFASTGLSSSYAFLIMTVNSRPGIQPSDISKEMQLTPSTVTRLIEKMEFRGLLKRKQLGRATEVYPTDEAIQLNFKIKKAWAELNKRYSDILGKEEGKTLANSIMDAAKKLD